MNQATRPGHLGQRRQAAKSVKVDILTACFPWRPWRLGCEVLEVIAMNPTLGGKALIRPLILGSLAMLALGSGITLRAADADRATAPAYGWQSGHWWWQPAKSESKWQHVLFRKTIEVTDQPVKVPLAISADAMYRLRVNGEWVTQGPARSMPGCATVDELDVARWLKPGKNVVAVEVVARPSGSWDCGYVCQTQALFFAIDLSRCPGAKESGWRCLEPRAYDDTAPLLGGRGAPVEVFDARKLDPAWQLASFDDAGWSEARDLGPAGTPPRSHMEARDVPMPVVKQVNAEQIIGFERGGGDLGAKTGDMLKKLPGNDAIIRMQNESRLPAVEPVSAIWPIQLPGSNHDVTVDFGLPYVGFLGLDVEGEEGTVLDVAWHEIQWPDGSVRPCLNLPMRQMFSYTLRAGRQRFFLMAPQTARFVRVVNRGNRPVKLHAVPLYTYVAPRPAATFMSSDPTLNRVFEAARLTANNCAIDLFMDCPERERNGWFHDSYWTSFTYTLLSGDASVLRRMCRMGSQSFTPAGKAELISEFVPHYSGTQIIPGHSLFWLLQAKLDAELSGDNDYAPQVTEGIHRFLKGMATFENKEGLLENVPGWNWLDWSKIRMDGAVVALNAIYSRALDAAADMTGKLDYRTKAEAIRETLCRLCPGTIFPDCLLRKGEALEPSPQQAEGTQYFALWCGVPGDGRSKALWQALRDGSNLSAANTYTHMQRLHYAALHGDIDALVRDVGKVYGKQVDSGPGTLWENLHGCQNAPGVAGCSYCQGAASGVAVALVQGVLGVQPIEGYRYVKIVPGVAGGVRWCRGSLPTKQGTMGVSWTLQGADFQLLASLPKGARARVVLPAAVRQIWEQKPASQPWPVAIEIDRSTRISVTPGQLEQNP